MTNSGTITINSGANRNDRIVNITSFDPRYCQRPAAYAAGMPITSDTITAPPQLIRLVSSDALKSTLVISVPLSERTVAKFDQVGLNWKYVVVCCSAFFSASTTIHAIGNSEKMNQKSRPASAATEPIENRFSPGSSSRLDNLSAIGQDSAPAARRCAFPSTLTR